MQALVQGASRGIGLALVEQLLCEQDNRVFATCRRANAPLQRLQQKAAGRLRVISLDVTDESSIAAAAACVSEQSTRLHLLINAAGVLHGPQMQPERRIEQVDGAALATSFAVHATGPLLVAKHFHRLLRHEERAVFASLSARVGSIGDNRLGGWYGYRASKAAQNMVTKTLAIELARRAPNVICAGLHPGTVDTDLSKPFQRNVPATRLFSVERAAKQLLSVIATLGSKDSGGFFDWKGARIPW
jgi:NAD(P)-dependent dehydrogenase (short-subunit alcohol dehydrogenase family)